ncbi:hypothetical protein GCM10023219_32400 [Stakelama sediminis]|uniref:Thoeris protein ThsB TIR-like domain-containing protein n=1 Tax=Stakelama sediminis TaxID=463200 RepID=A0A840Z0Q5_9SPHN|nr:TIR domain-containing protein [Stakelama sediminis]MBB5719568.1 hypothetical protein [Stakelama sediminis]
MARRVFFSFHFNNDFSRTQLVRNMGKLDGNSLATANRWEEIKQKGDQAVKDWIESNMSGKTCVVVLVGSDTASRRWVKYEIKKGWEDGRAVLGIYVNKLKDLNGNTSTRGASPFASVTANGMNLSGVPPMKIPSGTTSKEAYASISANISDWIEEAIETRAKYS